MTNTPLLVVMAGLVVAGCRGGAPESSTVRKAETAAADRNACHLLTPEEVSQIAGRRVTMADQAEAGDTFSTCEWEDEAGVSVFGLTVHWSGGKEQWEAWRIAQGLGDAALKSAAGVGGSDVVKQGLVPGIGDAAYFSPVLPSLVLLGDTLLEIKFSLAPAADTQFAGLATKLLGRLR